MFGHNFTMKFPPDFHNYTGSNGLVNSFSYFTIAPPNKLVLGCKSSLIYKSEKKKFMREVVDKKCSTKNVLLTITQN